MVILLGPVDFLHLETDFYVVDYFSMQSLAEKVLLCVDDLQAHILGRCRLSLYSFHKRIH